MTDERTIPPRFAAAYGAIRRLAGHERYAGAFIFGSIARGEATDRSDLDAQVLVNKDNLCQAINHPTIGGVKLDLSFLSFAHLRDATRREIERGWRIPMLAESIIVFDKTGELGQLRDEARRARPKPATVADRRFQRFMIFHANDKAERYLDTDPAAALLVMHTSLGALLEIHYRLQGRWWISNKRLLADLRGWDAPLAILVEALVSTADVGSKFRHWTGIIEHISGPLGGRRPLGESNCDCDDCTGDLAALAGAQAPGDKRR